MFKYVLVCLFKYVLVVARVSGLAIAERCAAEGASVVISSRKKANVDKIVTNLQAKGLDVFGLPCHVGKLEDIQVYFSS